MPACGALVSACAYSPSSGTSTFSNSLAMQCPSLTCIKEDTGNLQQYRNRLARSKLMTPMYIHIFQRADRMRWMMVALAVLAEQSPILAQSLDGDPVSGRSLATTLCSSCHHVLPMIAPDEDDPPSFQSIADLP